MRTILPVFSSVANQAQVGFMDHCCGLKCLRRPAPSQTAFGDAAQLTVNQREHLISSGLIAAGPLVQKFRYFSDGGRHVCRSKGDRV
jgi:hypothetical protein